MSDEEGGDALHDNVLIEGDADAEAQAEEDIDAAPATEARTAKEERRRRRKEKKRKSEAAEEEAAEQAEELVPEPLDADDELALQEVGLVEPVSAAAGDVETDGTKAKRRRAAKEEIRVADTEKQAAYLSRQLITKGGVEFALSAERLIPLDASADRSPGAIWTTLATEVPGFSDIASAGPQFKKKKHPEKESKKQRSEVPAAAGGAEQTAQGGEEGAPRLVVFAASAETGEVLFKALTGSVKSPVARAYQRRQKVDSQLAFLKNPVAAIVGLPPRLHKLADLGALSFARCEYIVIDMSRNTKSFDFFDVKEVRESFAELFHAYLAPLVQEGKARIVLY